MVLGPRWTQEIPKADEPEGDQESPKLGDRGVPTAKPRRAREEAGSKPSGKPSGPKPRPARPDRRPKDRRSKPPAAPSGAGVPAGESLISARGAGRAGAEPRERDVFEIASMVFGAVIAIFGLWGAIATIGGGIGSAGFVISVIFTLLGLGRLYFGFHGHRPVPLD